MLKLKRDEVEIQLHDNEINFVTDYSGRGMFGKTCFGIYGSARDLVTFLLAIAPTLDETLRNNPGDPAEEWLDMHHDNMGHDMIYYWPSITIE